MKSTNLWAALLSGLLLGGCSGNEGQRANVSLAAPLPVGAASSYLVSGDPAGSFGEAFIGTGGKGFVVVGPSDAQPAQALYRVSGGVVQRGPAGLPGAVTFDADSKAAIRTVPLTLAQLAGKYALVIDGVQSDIQIGADGKISTPDSACKLAGALGGGEGVTGTLPLSATLSGCTRSGSVDGYLISATEYQPGSFRLVAENGTTVLDAFAYKHVAP